MVQGVNGDREQLCVRANRTGVYNERRHWERWPSEYPHIEEKQKDDEKESKPHLPADAGAFGHAKHAIHISAESDSSALE